MQLGECFYAHMVGMHQSPIQHIRKHRMDSITGHCIIVHVLEYSNWISVSLVGLAGVQFDIILSCFNG